MPILLPKLITRRVLWLATVVFLCGCAVSQKTATKPSGPPVILQTASKQELVAAYNRQTEAVSTLNASVTMMLTAGSQHTGVIEQYHEVSGFIVADKPSLIRVIGQAPLVGTNIFDMESDGKTFRIYIPSQNKFLTGSTTLERQSSKPIENLRPQHLTSAIFWDAIPARDAVLFEEASEGASQYYVLTVARAAGAGGADWEIARKIWFERVHLTMGRMQIYDAGGKISSDIRYSGWDVAGTGATKYPREIDVERPGNDYQLQIGITKLTLNEANPPERFVLQQPAGAELVRVGDEPQSQGSKP